MDNTLYRVPRILIVLIVLILGSMYYYAAYLDAPSPEDTVTEFYEAYLGQDYELAASNVSVFWAAQLLPQYSSLSPEDLLEERDIIENQVSQFFAMIEAQSAPPTDIGIEVDSAYTRIGKYSALVVYDLTLKGEPVSMELAMLIKETDRFYIINLYPMNEAALQEVKEFDMTDLDTEFKEYLGLQN